MTYTDEVRTAYPSPAKADGAVTVAAMRCNDATTAVAEALELLDSVLRPVLSQEDIPSGPSRAEGDRRAPSSALGVDLDGLASRLTAIASGMRALAHRVEL